MSGPGRGRRDHAQGGGGARRRARHRGHRRAIGDRPGRRDRHEARRSPAVSAACPALRGRGPPGHRGPGLHQRHVRQRAPDSRADIGGGGRHDLGGHHHPHPDDAQAAGPDVASVEPPAPSGEGALLSRFAELSDTHARGILAAIAAFFVAAAVIGSPVVDKLEENPAGFEVPGGQAVKTEKRIAAATGEIPGAQLVVLVSGRRSVSAQETRREVARIDRAVRRDSVVSRTQTFYTTGDRGLVSRDRHSTVIAAYFKNVKETERQDAAERIAKRVDRPPDVLVGGAALATAQLNRRVSQDLAKAEALAFPILFLLSLEVFRGLVAALLPLLVGASPSSSLPRRCGRSNELRRAVDLRAELVVGLGLGLAIDYSLFIVSRYREELAAGRGDRSRPRGPRRFRATQRPGARCCTARSTVAGALASCSSSRCASSTRWASAARCGADRGGGRAAGAARAARGTRAAHQRARPARLQRAARARRRASAGPWYGSRTA